MAFYLYSINTGFHINESGYVGILNPSPKYALDISGDCKISKDLNIGKNVNGPFSFVTNIEGVNGAGFYTFLTTSIPGGGGQSSDLIAISGGPESPKIFDVFVYGTKLAAKKYTVAQHGSIIMVNTGLNIANQSYDFETTFSSSSPYEILKIRVRSLNPLDYVDTYTVSIFNPIANSNQKVYLNID